RDRVQARAGTSRQDDAFHGPGPCIRVEKTLIIVRAGARNAAGWATGRVMRVNFEVSNNNVSGRQIMNRGTAGRSLAMSGVARHAGRTLIAVAAALALGTAAQAADGVTVGLVSTLPGPGAGLGLDIADGSNLAVGTLGGALGGLPAEVLVVDDQQSPDAAKQTVDRLLKREKVDFVT